MMERDVSSGDSLTGTSRRGLLRSLGIASTATLVTTTSWATALSALEVRYDDQPVTLNRTKEGRSISLKRYHRAETAFSAVEAGFFADHIRDSLHQAGAVAKLALCAHLLDVGVSDAWCAKNLRQDISKALAYANATGLGHDCPDMTRLAVILTPYWKWGYTQLIGDPPIDHGGFTPGEVRHLIRPLLERVHDVTGHRRPKGWARRQREAHP